MKTLFFREEAGREQSADASAYDSRAGKFAKDIDDLLRPGAQNKYVYENIESEYYRVEMKRLA